jgi:hypothetical protein
VTAVTTTAIVIVLLWALCAILTVGVTILPWLIGVGWMAHHWLGV